MKQQMCARGALLPVIAICLAAGCGEDCPHPTCPDAVAPTAVHDLEAAFIPDSSAWLTWTSPGDDGDQGRAATYAVRYSLTPDTTADWWETAQPVTDNLPEPQAAGGRDGLLIASLLPDTCYYFALRTADEASNWSNVSNVAVLTTVFAPARVITVAADGSGDYATIQAAIMAARDGDVVELGEGTFMGEGNRDVDFLGKRIILRSRADDPDRCVIDCQGSYEDPHAAFLLQSGEEAGTLLAGLTVTHGMGSSETPPDRMHAVGILCSGSSPTILNCVFQGNQSFMGLDEVLSFSGGSALISGCTFADNGTRALGFNNCAATVIECLFCNSEGGVRIDRGRVTFDNCRFFDNSSYVGGGVLAHDARVRFVGCTLASNFARYGGAVSCSGGSLEMTRGTLAGNSAWGIASGILLSAGAHCSLDRIILAFGLETQAIWCEDSSSVTLKCCDLYGNAGGDWVGGIAGQLGVDGNISSDPLFLDLEGRDFRLQPSSLCSADSAACGQMGAWAVAAD